MPCKQHPGPEIKRHLCPEAPVCLCLIPVPKSSSLFFYRFCPLQWALGAPISHIAESVRVTTVVFPVFELSVTSIVLCFFFVLLCLRVCEVGLCCLAWLSFISSHAVQYFTARKPTQVACGQCSAVTHRARGRRTGSWPSTSNQPWIAII